jgi:hypothetical protein
MLRQGPISRFLHGAIEYAVGVLLIAAPFLFGFSDESGPTALFIILGVAHLLVTIGTRFKPPRGFADRAGAGPGTGDVADETPR